ncbi:protoheme IX farnesyltransferase, mitochondrial-like [Punica granatum]|uniref:Heme O synthase n=1 Tax=Punica granatum TaxID=22663 RepID=A0A6P8DZ19_PUNGR|nr:protoheme IX farnesyltransferase, mitochondrial-like [Punica granatum]
MKRTRQRPLPSGRISAHHAIVWASSVGIAGTALLAYKVNKLPPVPAIFEIIEKLKENHVYQANIWAAGLAASNLILYAFVYTPLKQIHPVNTWVGTIVGAIPPLLGWVAALGEISLNAMILLLLSTSGRYRILWPMPFPQISSPTPVAHASYAPFLFLPAPSYEAPH